jgi:hypothetical protein
MFKKSYFSKEPIFRLFKPPPSNANVLFISFVWNCIHRCHHCKHDVTTLHETLSAKLLSHDVISLECETKHTNLTLVNERQNNVTSSTNCPYLISMRRTYFRTMTTSLPVTWLTSLPVAPPQIITAVPIEKKSFGKFQTSNAYLKKKPLHAQPEVAQYLRLWDRKWRLSCPHILLTFHSLIIRFVS